MQIFFVDGGKKHVQCSVSLYPLSFKEVKKKKYKEAKGTIV